MAQVAGEIGDAIARTGYAHQLLAPAADDQRVAGSVWFGLRRDRDGEIDRGIVNKLVIEHPQPGRQAARSSVDQPDGRSALRR